MDLKGEEMTFEELQTWYFCKNCVTKGYYEE